MKKILYTLAIVFAGFNLQSCSLHEDTDLFGESAAERVDNAVKADRELLESAGNGWVFHYYKGENYSGGGYTFLCKFEDGKAVVAGDIADPTATARSSYDIVKDRGPVLTFDTYNEIMHALGTPSYGNIDGGEGDYEFIITKTTNDSIYLKGKKWGNQMVMTRMPENESWQSYLENIQKIDRAILYNNKVMVGNDSVAYASVDYSTRRIALEQGEGDQLNTVESPYYVTTDGIHLQTPITVNGKQLSDLKFNETTHELVDADGVTLAGFIPEGYHPIEFWAGNWTIVHAVADAEGNATDQYAGYPLTMNVYSASYLDATVTLNGYKFQFYMSYNQRKGTVNITAQYIPDPTDTYFGLMMAPVSFADGGYFNLSSTMNVVWSDADDCAYFVWDKQGDHAIDSYVLLAITSGYQPVIEDNGYVNMGQMSYIVGMQRAN